MLFDGYIWFHITVTWIYQKKKKKISDESIAVEVLLKSSPNYIGKDVLQLLLSSFW